MRYKNQLRIIKKYQNRRLYDTTTSTYIVLNDIKDIIVEGDVVQVLDVKTGEDVTRSVLLQIVLEEEVNGVPMFSNDFLFQIIRFYGKAFQPSLSPFLEQGVELFKKMQKQFFEQIKISYSKDGVMPSGVDLWSDFMKEQSPQLDIMVKDHLKNSNNAFLKMQEQLQKQAETILNYMQFSFNLGHKK